jgi:3',5'-cyclic AMP phosphodiesterase CpdA
MAMRVALLAHLSDLHIGRNQRTDERAQALCRALEERDVDHVVVSGDVTHRGRRRELARFRALFASLIEQGRLSVVPGNHDCLGDNVSADLMAGPRVAIDRRPGLHLVRFDSTGDHNRSFFAGHGKMTDEDIAAITLALDAAPPRAVVGLVLHHHLLPLPHDNSAERMISWLGWSSGGELAAGRRLLGLLRGRCDLVLHGHRHAPGTTTLFPADRRPLAVFNAGSSTGFGHVRVFVHAGGRLTAPPAWVAGSALPARPFREVVTQAAPEPGGLLGAALPARNVAL